MDWVLRSPQIHSTFSKLGFVKKDGYHINDNCNATLETILQNILSEDKYLRSYRRSISYGQNIQKYIIPLIIHTKDDKTVELIVRILVNLTIPIECLLNVDLISKTDYGRYTIFDINNLLSSTKVAFTDLRVSKALVDLLKKNSNVEPKVKLSEVQRTNVSNCLLLLRNILHVPENDNHLTQNCNGSTHPIQNQILWNIFSQSIDKIIIKSMTILDANCWGVTMVQLLALLYKDQNNATLTKLLNNWLEASLSESSEDNESNTSPPDRAGSENSSRMLTSDLTSDSSDNSSGDKCGSSACMNASWEPTSSLVVCNEMFTPIEQDKTNGDKAATSRPDTGDDKSSGFGAINEEQAKLYNDTTPSFLRNHGGGDRNKNQKEIVTSEASDCGYGTHMENHESISTSSNEDDVPAKKPVHQKPHNAKQRPNNKPRLGATTQDCKRRKMVKRGKGNITNVQGLFHKTPTDDNISNVLKEFTVDFLLKGYNSLVLTLHSEILTNPLLEIDTSHFFWLLTYFLKFASQIELNLEHVDSVLSFEIVSYLTSEGVNLCEQFELAIKLDDNDLDPNMRRQHLVVTAIREFVQAIEKYTNNPQLNEEDTSEKLKKLKNKMCETEDLRSLFVLLLRHFNPKYHSNQYLQDIIVTNHMVLLWLDKGMKLPEYKSSLKLIDHLQQFATTPVMAQYGLLLNDYMVNGEYVNDCIFTLMHHVAGDLNSLKTLFQPNILKIFTTIWKSDFEICDDWSDLIEYVINTFVGKPSTLITTLLFPKVDIVEESKMFARPFEMTSSHSKNVASKIYSINENNVTVPILERWTEDEISALNWNYLQSNAHADVISLITKQLKEDGINKTSESVITELFRQNLVSRDFYEKQMKGKRDFEVNMKTVQPDKENREDEIAKFCENLKQEGKAAGLDWVQEVLLEICNAKMQIHEKNLQNTTPAAFQSKLLSFEIFRIKHDEMPVVSPVAYHALIRNESVPLIPWNCQQASICKDLKFLQLFHKLGFQMPVDTGKLFIRVPHSWTVDFLLSVAGKIRPIDTSKLKFKVSELSDSGVYVTKLDSTRLIEDVPLMKSPGNYYQLHEPNLATMINYTPRPSSLFKPEVEVEQFTWLQFVQKSQGRKINLNFESLNAEEDTEMELPVENDKISAALDPHAAAPSCFIATTSPTAPLQLPRTMPIPAHVALNSYSQMTAAAPIESLADTELFGSAFETASVASDLTYMYVSDEDEKTKVTIPPITNSGNSSTRITLQPYSRKPAKVEE